MNINVNSVNHFDFYTIDNLLSPGLTFNDVNKNIIQKADIVYLRNRDIAVISSACIGTALGIATLVASIFLVICAPVILIAAPILLLCTYAAGVISYEIGSTIGTYMSSWIRSSEKAHQQFFDQFEGTATVEIHDLKYQPNQILQKEMIAKMNFDQLSFARHKLGETKFLEVISDVNKDHHNLWKTILNFTSYSEETILTKLNTSGIKSMIKNSPMFARELRKQLKGVHNQEIQKLLHPFPLFKYSEDAQKKNNIIFTFAEGNTIQTNKELLLARSNYFKNSGLENSDEKEVLASNYADISSLVNALTSETLILDKEKALNLIRIADQYDEDRLLKYIENYIVNNISDFNNNEILGLIKKYGQNLLSLREMKDKQLCIIKITEKNWNEKKEVAKDYQLPLLTKKCFDFTTEIIQKDLHYYGKLTSVGSHWLQESIGMDRHENSELINLLVQLITFENFQVIYDFAKQQKNEMLLNACVNLIQAKPNECIKLAKNEWMRRILTDLSEKDYSKFSIGLRAKISIDSVRTVFELAQDKKDEKLKEASIAFIGKNSQKIKDEHFWALEEIPDEILPILYPSKK